MNHISRYIGKSVDPHGISAARAAVYQACNQMAAEHDWTYYHTMGRIVTAPTYRDGTISVEPVERLVSLLGGVWPAWSESAVLRVGNVLYDVDRRLSDTQLVLRPGSSPGGILTDRTYSLFRESYDLPLNFVSMGEVGIISEGVGLSHHPYQDIASGRHHTYGEGKPAAFTICGSALSPGRMAVRLWPPSDIEYVIDYSYKRRMERAADRERHRGHGGDCSRRPHRGRAQYPIQRPTRRVDPAGERQRSAADLGGGAEPGRP